MPTFQITGPNGKKYRVTGDNAEGALKALQNSLGGSQAQPQTLPRDEGESWSPGNAEFGSLEPVDPGFLGNISNRLYDAGKAIGLPVSQMRRDMGSLNAGVRGAADVFTLGTADEIAAGLGSMTGVGGKADSYDQNLELQRAIDANDAEQHPSARIAGQLGGGAALGALVGPLTASARFAGSTLAPRALAGMADGGVLGGLYGAGSGENAKDRLTQGAMGAGTGLIAGAAFPLVGAGASKLYETGKNLLAAGPIARQAGASPPALRLLGKVLDADGSLGTMGQANMARAGSDAMLADAGPNARAVLDTAIQRGGPGAIDARRAITDRTGRATNAVADALNANLGQPEGVTAARTAIRQGSAGARKGAYDAAYAQPIDYADPIGQEIESIVKSRVPGSAIQQANALMRANGDQSRQILARVADDGSVTFERLPDVRQLDYITRALNDVASAENGKGKLGGTTALGNAYEGLSKEIRDRLRDLVPEYGTALETAADPIQRSKAVELGSKLLSPSMTRDQVNEAVRGMTGPEKDALAQGVRSRLDDVMANVTRTVQDGSTDAREAIKAIKDLSSRANREKLTVAIGEQKARALFDELDRAATSFDLRASVAENSKTYARQATERRIGDMTGPGAIGKAAQGEPLQATKRIVQALTGMTPEKIRGKEDAVYSEIARLLTRQGGAGQGVYDAIGKLGQTDQAAKLMSDRIVRALSGPRLSYPAATLGVEYTRK